MVKRALVGGLLTAAVLVWVPAQGAERPLSEAIRAAADAVRPAVVTIEVKGRKAGPDRPGLIVPFDPFGEPPKPGEKRDFRFEFQWPPQEGEAPNLPLPFRELRRGLFRAGPQQDEGTGLILEVEGERALVAAPQPLVAGAEQVFVRLADGRQLAAKTLGTDPLTGTACLEVRGAKLAAAKPGNAEGLEVGDWVVAVGGPASGGAITLGIVSAKNRPGQGEMAGTQVVLADITLAEGMAGGPLVNLNGEVVGMTVQTGGARQGRGLTTVLPVNTLAQTVRALAKEGKVRRGFLGIMLQPMDPEALQQLNVDHGIQAAQLVKGQPADVAGIKDGDVLLEFGGKRVAEVDAFRGMVSSTAPGTRVPVKVLRGGKEMIIEVTVGEQQGEGGAPAPQAPGGGEKLDLGLTLQPLTPDLAAQLGYGDDKGLVATTVAADSPASKARPAAIRQGELIKEIARKPVASVAEARQAIADARKAKEKTLLILVRSKEGARYVVLDLPQ
jgi:serine protease Do